MGSAAASGVPDPKRSDSPPGFMQVPSPVRGQQAGAAAALQDVFERHGDRIAGFMFEPISARTAEPIPARFLQLARALCDKHGSLMVADEVTTGFGRTGAMFAHPEAGIDVDILCTSKGLAAGYASIGAVTTREALFTEFERTKNMARFVHGHTHSGHATACATALAVLRHLDAGRILENVRARHHQLVSRLVPTLGSRGDVSLHGRGLFLGLLFADPASATYVREGMLADRVLVRRTGRSVLLTPPLILDEGEADRLADSCLRAITAIGKQPTH